MAESGLLFTDLSGIEPRIQKALSGSEPLRHRDRKLYKDQQHPGLHWELGRPYMGCLPFGLPRPLRLLPAARRL